MAWGLRSLQQKRAGGKAQSALKADNRHPLADFLENVAASTSHKHTACCLISGARGPNGGENERV
jgi:hypothetical protein